MEFHIMDSCLNDVFMSSMQCKDVFPKNTKRRVQYDKRCMFSNLDCYLYVYVGDDDSFALPAEASKQK